jgi:hypothetical protein
MQIASRVGQTPGGSGPPLMVQVRTVRAPRMRLITADVASTATNSGYLIRTPLHC